MYVPPPKPPRTKDIIELTARAPFQWLRLGWLDLVAHPWLSLFYGLCFWIMAFVLWVVFHNKPEYLMSMISGCVLVGPFLSLGLYEISRCSEQGQPARFTQSLMCWRSHLGSMGLLVLVLMLLELLWGRASLVVFAVFFNTGMPSTSSVVQAIFNMGNWQFVVVYFVIGSVFASLVFSTCVVSLPMILDRDTDAISAAITSIEVVLTNTKVLVIWGLLISVLIFSSLMPWGLGILIVGPWLGYASWHAYRGTVRWLTFANGDPQAS